MTRGFISEHLWPLSPRCDPCCLCLSDFGWKKGLCLEAKSRIHWALDGRIPIVLAGALAKRFPDLMAGKPSHQTPWLHWVSSLACLLI